MTVVEVTLRVSVTGFGWGRLRTSAARWTVVWARTGAAIAISAINATALLRCMTPPGRWEMPVQYAKAMPRRKRLTATVQERARAKRRRDEGRRGTPASLTTLPPYRL